MHCIGEVMCLGIFQCKLLLFREGPGQRPQGLSQQRTVFCSDFLTLQFTLFTLLKNGQVNFIVQLSKFPSQNSDY